MKRDLNTKTLTGALLLSIVSVAMGAPQTEVNRKLFQAVKAGDTKTINDLIKKENANVNAKSKRGRTPLIVAAKEAGKPNMDSKMAAITRTLLRNDANASLKGPGGMTALILAAQGGADKTVKALLRNKEARKTINMKDRQGKTALGYAAETGNTKITNLLLRHEATPTRMAIEKAKTEKIREKLQKKWDELKKAGKLPRPDRRPDRPYQRATTSG